MATEQVVLDCLVSPMEPQSAFKSERELEGDVVQRVLGMRWEKTEQP